jgi:flagellar motor switch protein FliG
MLNSSEIFKRLLARIGATLCVISWTYCSFSVSTAIAQSQDTRPGRSVDLLQQIEDAIDDRYRNALEAKVSEYLSQRFTPSEFTYAITTSINRQEVEKLAQKVVGIQDNTVITSLLVAPQVDTILIKISKMSYGDIRRFVAKADVSVTFSNRIDASEWKSAITTLNALVRQGTNPPETVTGSNDQFAQSMEEYLKLREINELEKKESRISKQQHEQRKDEIRLRNNVLQENVDQLKRDNMALAEQINAEEVPLKLARDWPQLLKWLTLGAILGSLIVLAMMMLGMGLFASSKTFGHKVVTAAKEAGTAVKEAFAGQAIDSLHKLALNEDTADRVREIKKAILEKTDDDTENVEPDLLEELKKAILELRSLVEKDIVTSSAQVTRLIEGKELHKVMMLFDLLGEALSKKLFDAMHSKYHRELKRHFYLVGPRPNPSPKTLYLLVVEFKAMLTATNILVRKDAEKLLNQILLSYSSVEMANALRTLSAEKATDILVCLHPKRVAEIMKRIDANTASAWRREIVKTVQGPLTLDVRDVRLIHEIITSPDKVRFEESVAYLKGLMGELSDIEQEDIVDGAADNPKLKAAISGLRSSMEDLWVQAISTISRLVADLDLSMLAALLAEAPDEIRRGIVNETNGRRRELLLDELAVLDGNEKAKKLAIRSNANARRRVLDRLADLADEGEVELPFTRPESINTAKKAA